MYHLANHELVFHLGSRSASFHIDYCCHRDLSRKTGRKPEHSLLKRRAKPILYALTGLALFASVSQIWRTDRENQNNEKKRSQEREADKSKSRDCSSLLGH
jgi:hypothetical protein